MNDKNTSTQSQQKQETGRSEKISESGRGILLFLYLVFGTSFLIAVVPVSSVSVFALMTCICILAAIYTYRVRGGKAKNKLVIAHTTYIIRTFWHACLIFIISSFLGLLYMLVAIKYGPLEKCADAMFDAVCNGHLHVLLKIFEICGNLLVAKNKMCLQIVGFIAFSPVFLYVLWRCARGGMRLVFEKPQSGK